MSRVVTPVIEGRGGIVTDEFGHIDGGGAGPVMQSVYGENQVRPTVLTEPAPGGTFATVLAVPITTTSGTFLDISAELGGIVDGGAGSTYIDAGIRILVDGVSTGIGSFQTTPQTPAQPYVSVSMVVRVSIAPGLHSVELQWNIGGDGAADKNFGFLNPDFDGCAMWVRELR